MKSTIVLPFLIISLLGTSVAAFAQQHDENHGGGQPSHDRPNPGHDVQHGHGRGPAPRDASMGGPGGPVPHNDWHKGERLPAEYRDRNYVVDDWRGHGLQPPPRGYQWVGVNGDYVLAAIATGVIANVLLTGH
ncbi:Ni/Co efflux regulator RcnB [Paraburkholderia sp. GAS448]|uniref:RcnB family protein n=1 Tax=Paraburkholderia sp. GAS448 TaxID=3035136 RepID=UPI003D24F876